ncbi:type VII secretion integral membrane protein EccD [Saccharopolyspora antimicrobica]|uniref:Type VII secretion integral membrane protein EccD n=1 Tax=Saccharopolyspora antimicrobica TaxID=455193 RepID=A0A1I5G5S7_9PSEU|nr:type VII secretion integral membrane protein EccD [Saccharopolyspora antimicrobica]RKT83911.1 type VII secretion integral membrane protein EccD [Saccharopolyspora antimicrobica]SFO31377.1 type VII secretion integral membrane protein EccD [Saccharopolyspora antimicrobica]
MSSALGTTLAKVTISTPKRGIDVALPEDVAVAELLPYILRHAGDDAADAGERHGGWALRRTTGDRLDPKQTLGAQGILDGEVLHLVPGQSEWPEIEYDDLVETIASGARQNGRSWGRAATRRCGLAVAGSLLLGGTLITLLFRGPWLLPGLVLLTTAVALTALGIVVARAVPDARAGALFAGCALPYAFLGGLLITAPAHVGLLEFGSAQLLVGTVALLVLGTAGYVGVAAEARVFVAAIAVGLFGTLGAAFGGWLGADAAAALVLTAGIALLPGYPLLAIRLGRLPVPELPQRAADMLADKPAAPTSTVFAAARRTDEILTGLLIGLAATAALCVPPLLAHGGAARLTMLALGAAALLLRSRLFPIPRQRIPLLIAGLLVAAGFTAGIATGFEGTLAPALTLLTLVLVALLVAAAGVVYAQKTPSPHLGRIADWTDVLAVLALIPYAAYTTGFFTYVQGLMASIG